MATSKKQYDQKLVDAAHRVLLELAHLLQSYADGVVVVGGSVPSLILGDTQEAHIGSIDVDIALDQHKVQEVDYHSIQKLLLDRGYETGTQPFSFSRIVKIENQEIKVKVDFLAGEYGGTGEKHRTQRVQDMRPRKARACDLAFNHSKPVLIEGVLPEGGMDQAIIHVASIVPFLMMKAQALKGRLKEKDAYDIYFCLCNYPGGNEGLVKAFQHFPANKLIDEGLIILKEKFNSPEHIGPVFVADFLGETNSEFRERVKRDAYERMNALLNGIDILLNQV